MAPHSSTLAWKIPRAEEPGRLQSGLTLCSFLRMSPEGEQGGRDADWAQEGKSHVTLVEAEPPD